MFVCTWRPWKFYVIAKRRPKLRPSSWISLSRKFEKAVVPYLILSFKFHNMVTTVITIKSHLLFSREINILPSVPINIWCKEKSIYNYTSTRRRLMRVTRYASLLKFTLMTWIFIGLIPSVIVLISIERSKLEKSWWFW